IKPRLIPLGLGRAGGEPHQLALPIVEFRLPVESPELGVEQLWIEGERVGGALAHHPGRQRQSPWPADGDPVGRHLGGHIVGERQNHHALRRGKCAQLDEIQRLEEAACRPSPVMTISRSPTSGSPMTCIFCGWSKGMAMLAVFLPATARATTSARVGVASGSPRLRSQDGPSALKLATCGCVSFMRTIASPSAPRVTVLDRTSSLDSAVSSAFRSILAALSKTSHSVLARRNTAAAVGTANGNSSRSLSPERCKATTTGAFGSGGGGFASPIAGGGGASAGLTSACAGGSGGGAGGGVSAAGAAAGGAAGIGGGAAAAAGFTTGGETAAGAGGGGGSTTGGAGAGSAAGGATATFLSSALPA